jgi:hypothetical protein
MTKLKYVGIRLTNKNCMPKDIKSILNSRIPSTIWLRDLLIPTAYLKTQILNKILHKYNSVVLDRCGTRSLTLCKEQMVSLFYNRMLQKIVGPKWQEVGD